MTAKCRNFPILLLNETQYSSCPLENLLPLGYCFTAQKEDPGEGNKL